MVGTIDVEHHLFKVRVGFDFERTSVVHVVQKTVVRAPRKTHKALTTAVTIGPQR
jgi:hypothetical protein